MRQRQEGDAIDELLQRVGKIDSITAQLILRDAYEVAFGIYNHKQPDPMRPLALVAMHPKENVSEYSELYNEIRRFDRHDMARAGYSLLEYLSLPRELAHLLIRTRTERARGDLIKAQAAADALNELDRG